MAQPEQTGHSVVTTENADATGPFVIICEHASNAFPQPFGTLGLSSAARRAHIAWDPGALGVARQLSSDLRSPLVAANVSRLIYDLNRPPHAPAATAEKSETFDIPGNRGLGGEERQRRTEAVYLPFHAEVQRQISRRLAAGKPPAIVTVHSFTPLWFGKPRPVELGLIHDGDAALAEAMLTEAKARTSLDCRMNEPYSARDGVTHTLRLHAVPYGLAHVMVEIRNDLIADDEAQNAIGAGLAVVLDAALQRIAAAPRKATA